MKIACAVIRKIFFGLLLIDVMPCSGYVSCAWYATHRAAPFARAMRLLMLGDIHAEHPHTATQRAEIVRRTAPGSWHIVEDMVDRFKVRGYNPSYWSCGQPSILTGLCEDLRRKTLPVHVINAECRESGNLAVLGCVSAQQVATEHRELARSIKRYRGRFAEFNWQIVEKSEAVIRAADPLVKEIMADDRTFEKLAERRKQETLMKMLYFAQWKEGAMALQFFYGPCPYDRQIAALARSIDEFNVDRPPRECIMPGGRDASVKLQSVDAAIIPATLALELLCQEYPSCCVDARILQGVDRWMEESQGRAPCTVYAGTGHMECLVPVLKEQGFTVRQLSLPTTEGDALDLSKIDAALLQR